MMLRKDFGNMEKVRKHTKILYFRKQTCKNIQTRYFGNMMLRKDTKACKNIIFSQRRMPKKNEQNSKCDEKITKRKLNNFRLAYTTARTKNYVKVNGGDRYTLCREF